MISTSLPGLRWTFLATIFLNAIHTEAQMYGFVDPDLSAFSKKGFRDSSDDDNFRYCLTELAQCKNNMVSGSGTEDRKLTTDVLDQMKNVVGNWMFLSGFQNLHLPSGDEKSVSIKLTLSDIDLRLINKYLNEPSYGNFMNTIPILNRFFTLPRLTLSFQQSINTNAVQRDWVKIISNIIIGSMNKETLLVLTSIILGFLLLKVIIYGAELRVIVAFFLVAVFFAGFLWNWCYMYQKAVVDQHVRQLKYQSYASSCKPDDSFFGFIKSLFGYSPPIDECTEYFRGKNIDPIILVPPTLALSETVSMFIIHPSVLMAEAMQKITKILFGNMMWGVYFGTPLVMAVFGIVFSVIFLALFIILTGRGVQLKCWFLSISIGSETNQYLTYPRYGRRNHDSIEYHQQQQLQQQQPNQEITSEQTEQIIVPRENNDENITINTNRTMKKTVNNSSELCSQRQPATCCNQRVVHNSCSHHHHPNCNNDQLFQSNVDFNCQHQTNRKPWYSQLGDIHFFPTSSKNTNIRNRNISTKTRDLRRRRDNDSVPFRNITNDSERSSVLEEISININRRRKMSI